LECAATSPCPKIAMENFKPVRLGIIGCGWIMRYVYAPILLSMPDRVRVATVCDLDESARAVVAGQFTDVSVFTDAGAMLREGDLDAVLVLTSEKVNARVARMVLQKNLPVYLEKPPAVNSVELEELITAETQNPAKIYTAFNRRHTPLFSNLNFSPTKIRRVHGAFKRLNRSVATFPYTSIHLIDSAQYFANSLFKSWKLDFKRKAESSIWTIRGHLENGAECTLELVPDGKEFAEFLVLETDVATYEFQFPNADAVVREGEIILRPGNGAPPRITRGEEGTPFLEATGFRPCLLDFLRQLETGNNSAHRLASCRSTIGIMEEMKIPAREP
jgi:hypothetical protein